MFPLIERSPTVDPTDSELSAYLDEMLASSRAAEIERLLRDRADLRERVALLARRRDQGGHTLGEIWRRAQLSCLSRSQLGSYLLGAADRPLGEYIHFHLTVIECRICQANLEDLQCAQTTSSTRQTRQRRYFESSAGLLKNSHDLHSR